ncbi:MAG: VanZ family protein [Eubacterium sp.]|nr:VanZ family protein [Eubacterium sp.]MDE6154865.1 VanZ family protein [Eubacterium sp.]
MRQEKIKTALCWMLVIVCMGVIFWLSSRTADESAAQSGTILQWLINIFGDNLFTDFVVRKAAHCLEFTGLCVLFNLAFYQTRKKTMPLISIACTSLYAATDEFHQLFVDGRSCQFTDWIIDSCGAILGAIGFMILYKMIIYIKQKSTKFIDSENI